MVPDCRHGVHWSVIAAIVGYLAFSVAGGAAEPERRPPIAERGQAVERQPDRAADGEQNLRSKPAWLLGIETGEKASATDCGDPKDCRAEKRAYSDLRAQWQAAEAANGQESLARSQTIIAGIATIVAGIGTCYLIWTFRETRKTANAALASVKAADRAAAAAEAAVADAREVARRELRAYVFVEKCQITFFQKERILVELKIRNSGQTPAYKLKIWGGVVVDELNVDCIIHITSVKAETKVPVADLGPNGVRDAEYTRDPFSDQEAIILFSGEHAIYAFGGVEYLDCFGVRQTGEFRFSVVPPIKTEGTFRMTYGHKGNEYT